MRFRPGVGLQHDDGEHRHDTERGRRGREGHPAPAEHPREQPRLLRHRHRSRCFLRGEVALEARAGGRHGVAGLGLHAGRVQLHRLGAREKRLEFQALFGRRFRRDGAGLQRPFEQLVDAVGRHGEPPAG
jgi:hypothetical protein